MNAIWVIFKLAIIVVASFFIASIDGYVNIIWNGYVIDMSATVFVVGGLILSIVIWKLAKVFAFSASAPKAYFLNRKSEQHKSIVQMVIESENAFYKKDINALEKTLKKAKKILGEKSDVIVLIQIQIYVLQEKYSNALLDYKKSIKQSISQKAGYILHATNSDYVCSELLKIQNENQVLQDWAYIELANKYSEYDTAIAQIDLGVNNKAICKNDATIHKALLAVKFNQGTALNSILDIWTKTHSKVLLEGFESLSYAITLKDFKVAEKALKKDNSPYGYLALSYLACGVEIWGLSRQYLDMAKGIDDREYYRAIANIEKSEKGKTEVYYQYLEKLLGLA